VSNRRTQATAGGVLVDVLMLPQQGSVRKLLVNFFPQLENIPLGHASGSPKSTTAPITSSA
jgi:hypothetical protein